MALFAKTYTDMGCGTIFFSQLANWETWPRHIYNDQIVWREDHPEYESFLKVMESDILGHPRVCLGNLTPYRELALRRKLKNMNWVERVVLKVKFYYADLKRRRFFMPKIIQDFLKRRGYLKNPF